jgi:GNAT superfamily N-acetyltransferase
MVTVREASEKDIPRILELYQQLAFDPSTEAPVPAHEECLRIFSGMCAVPGYSLLVAEEDGEVTGTAVLAILPGFSHGGSPFALVEYVVVEEQKRSRGTGKVLMEYAMSRAREAGCYKIMLTSDKRREEAHRFYESLGFEASAEGFRYYFH